MFLANTGSSNIGFIILLIVVFGFMYFVMIRPQKKQQQQHQEMLKQLNQGDKVKMIGGLHGKVHSIDQAENTVVIDANGLKLTFDINAIRTVDPKNDKPETDITVKESDNQKGDKPVEEKFVEDQSGDITEVKNDNDNK